MFLPVRCSLGQWSDCVRHSGWLLTASKALPGFPSSVHSVSFSEEFIRLVIYCIYITQKRKIDGTPSTQLREDAAEITHLKYFWANLRETGGPGNVYIAEMIWQTQWHYCFHEIAHVACSKGFWFLELCVFSTLHLTSILQDARMTGYVSLKKFSILKQNIKL